jgi:hypothetical protein
VADKITNELKPKIIPIEAADAPGVEKTASATKTAPVEIVWANDEDVLNENELRRQRLAEMLPFLKGSPGRFALLAEKAHRFASGGSFGKDFKGVTVAHRSAGKDDRGANVYDLYVKWEKK